MQLSFQTLNSAGGTPTQNIIYITPDATYNKVSLAIQLSTGSTQLSPGTIPSPDSPPASGTTFYVDLSALQLSEGVWDALSLSATNWTFKKFPGQGVFGMTPSVPLIFNAGTTGVIDVAIGGIAVPQALAAPQVQLYASYYNVPDVDGMYSAFAVVLQNRPGSGEDLSQALTVLLSANGIVNSPTPLLTARNAFGLQFSSTQQVSVSAGPDTFFTVGFVYGNTQDTYGFGALTAVDGARQIAATRGLNADGWVITGNASAQSPYWTLQPPNGAPIVGTGPQSIVEIDFSNIVTPYQPGPTAMLIAYSGVPGYKDGVFALVLNKVAHAQIGALQVMPNPARFSGGSSDVTVSWMATNAKSLALTQNYQTTPVTGLKQIPAVLNAESTVFTLTATGAPGTVENVDYKSVTAIALPVVNSFVGTPTEIFSGSQSHNAAFAWSVDSTDGVTLSSTGGAFSGQAFDATGSTTVSITEPQMITLEPVTAINPLTLTRRIIISAFTPTPESFAVSPAPGAVATSPAGPFVLTGSRDANDLSVLDTVRYASMGSVTTGHKAIAIEFSPDGGTVATANADNTVSIVNVTQGADGRPSFGRPQTIAFDTAPQALTFSNNGPRIFVTLAGAQGQPGQVVSLRSTGGEPYRSEATVTVGQNPAGITADAAGSRLFVANTGDDTVTMVGLTQDGALAGTTTIHEVAGGPTGVAASPSGQQLLVSCAKSGTVLVLDPNHPDTGQRKTLGVGKSPGQIGITPNGAYAFVANGGDGTVSMLDCSGLPSNASVAGAPIAVGGQPAGIAVSPEGLQVLVGAGAALSVVTLATYEASSNVASIPNQPTSVESFVDGSVVFVWHDASLPSVSKAPGIVALTVQTTEQRNVLADKFVLRCLVSPDPLSRQAFAIALADPTLYLIDTATLATTPQALRLDAGASPVAMAISGEGDTLWIVASDAQRQLSLAVLTLSTATGSPVWTQQQAVPLYQAAKNDRILLRATPDGTSLFVVETGAARARVIRRTGQSYTLSSQEISGDVTIIDLAVLPSGTTAYVLNSGSSTNTITVVDVATLKSYVAAVPQTYVNLRALQPSPDGRKLFAVDTNAAAVRVFDPDSLRIVQTISMQSGSNTLGASSGLSVAPDGSRVFTAHTDTQKVSFIEQIQMGLGGTKRFRRGAPTEGRIAAESYSGLFMRHDLSDSPSTPTSGWSSSPDVIPYGANIAPDLSIFTTPAGYAAPFNQDVNPRNPIYVYVRGLNTTAAQITSRAYFYFTRGSLCLWPADWTAKGVSVNSDTSRNWVDVTAPPISSTSNGVGVGALPLKWIPQEIDPNQDHFCVIAWVDNRANPQPPDFDKLAKFETFDDMVQFITSHHNMAWRNTHEVIAPPPDLLYDTILPLKAGGGSVMLTVNFVNVPGDGHFSVNVQGTDKSNSVSIGPALISDYKGGFSPNNNPLVFPPNFQTSVQVNHWPGPTPVPPDAMIRVTMAVQTAPSLMRDIERRYRTLNLRTPFTRWNGIPVFIVGTNRFDLKFGAAAANANREFLR